MPPSGHLPPAPRCPPSHAPRFPPAALAGQPIPGVPRTCQRSLDRPGRRLAPQHQAAARLSAPVNPSRHYHVATPKPRGRKLQGWRPGSEESPANLDGAGGLRWRGFASAATPAAKPLRACRQAGDGRQRTPNNFTLSPRTARIPSVAAYCQDPAPSPPSTSGEGTARPANPGRLLAGQAAPQAGHGARLVFQAHRPKYLLTSPLGSASYQKPPTPSKPQ